MARVAVVDDDTDVLFFICQALHERGWDAITHRKPEFLVEWVKAERPDVIIVDIGYRDYSGWKILEQLVGDHDVGDIPLIICSGAIDDLQTNKVWLRLHRIVTVPKPFDLDGLERAVEAVLEQASRATTSAPPVS